MKSELPKRFTGPHFSHLLVSLTKQAEIEQISLGAIAEWLGRRSMGSLLLFLALPMVLPIPAPGISVIFGVPLIVISAELLFGRETLWLPRGLRNRTLSRASLGAYVERALPLVRKAERLVRPRFSGWTHGLSLRAVGAMCLVLAIVITLPVPLGHLVPGAAISVMAVGLIEGDGLALALGMAVGALALLVVALAFLGVVTLAHAFS